MESIRVWCDVLSECVLHERNKTLKCTICVWCLTCDKSLRGTLRALKGRNASDTYSPSPSAAASIQCVVPLLL